MKISPFKATYPNIDVVPPTNDFFDSVKLRYDEYVRMGFYKAAGKEAIYIYQIKDKFQRKYTGIVVCTDVQDFYNNNMRKHEKTIVNKEDIQGILLQKRGAAIKPVLLTHPSVPELEKLLDDYIDSHKKFYVLEVGNEKHRFWQVTESPIIEQIQNIFETQLQHTYIADGHHRSASFAALHEKMPNDKTKKILTAYFPISNLEIKEQSRWIKTLNGLSPEEFIEKLRDLFKVKVIKKGAKPYSKFELTMYLDGQWYQLYWKKTGLKGFDKDMVLLDVHLLNERVLKSILDINNIRTDNRISYVDGSKSIAEIETLTHANDTEGVVFCLYPVAFEDLQKIADTQGTLPPKSTFFEPRMKNGLLVYEL